MKFASKLHQLYLILRWSYTVPILCYFLFFLTIWMLAVPLKPIKTAKHLELRPPPEDSFEIRLRNSNFNSDKRETLSGGENGLLNDKNEYLVNVNNVENVNKDQTEILQDVFRKADANKNGKLEPRELSEWIRLKIVEHISSAVGNNYALFTKIDTNPRNGVITWREYHSYFLKRRGFSKKYVDRHDEKRHKGLQRSIKEQIMRDRASWAEAARSNPDALTVDEFLAFTHPESSAANQLALVDELFDRFDRDGDELLTEDEFAAPPDEGAPADGEGPGRRAEFRRAVDANGDGRADRRELLHYVAPQSPRHSEHEAGALLALADGDRDGALSLDEMLAHPDLFLKSKMVDTARSFHDEF